MDGTRDANPAGRAFLRGPKSASGPTLGRRSERAGPAAAAKPEPRTAPPEEPVPQPKLDPQPSPKPERQPEKPVAKAPAEPVRPEPVRPAKPKPAAKIQRQHPPRAEKPARPARAKPPRRNLRIPGPAQLRDAAGDMFLPGLFTAFWLVIVMAYGVGYLSGEAPIGALELLFFVAVLSGPIAMLWMGVWLQNRAQRLVRATETHAATTRELANAVAGLEAVYGEASDRVGARLDARLAKMEGRIDDASGALAEMLEALTDEARVILVNRCDEIAARLGEAGSLIAEAVSAQREGFVSAVEETSRSMKAAFNGRAEEIRSIMGTRAKDIDRALGSGAARIERGLAEMEGRIDQSLSSALARADAALVARAEALEAGLTAAEQRIREGLESRLNEIDAMMGGASATIERQGTEIERALLGASERFEGNLENHAESLATRIDGLIRGISGRVAARTEEIDRRLANERDAVTTELEKLSHTTEMAGGALREAVENLADDLAARLSRSSSVIDQSMGSTADQLGRRFEEVLGGLTRDIAARAEAVETALSRANHVLSEGVSGEVAALQQTVESVREGIAARPPASAGELAALLGKAAEQLVGPERAAVEKAVARFDKIETQTRRLVYAAERAARLVPLAGAEADTAAEAEPTAPLQVEGEALPFGERLGQSPTEPPAWPVVIRALDFPEDAEDEAGQHALARASRDPVLGPLLRGAEAVLSAFASEGLFMDDLKPVHAGPEEWARLGREGVPPRFGPMGDAVAEAVARNRLATDPSLREAALRMLQAWQRLMGRSAHAVGSDPVLVELADTRTGRAVMLVGRVTGAFPPPQE